MTIHTHRVTSVQISLVKALLVFLTEQHRNFPKTVKTPTCLFFFKSLHLNSTQVAQHFVTSMHPGGFINSADSKQEAQDGLFSFFPLFK